MLGLVEGVVGGGEEIIEGAAGLAGNGDADGDGDPDGRAAGPGDGAVSVRDLAAGHHAEATVIGMALTAVALAVMPPLGRAKHTLAARLGSAATAGEGTPNYLCAAQAAAVLAGLAVTAAWPAAWWLDPAIALGIAAVAVREGIRSWRGGACC